MLFHRGLPVNPPVKTMHLLKLPIGECFAAVLSPSTSDWVSVQLHYCTEANRRVLCEGPKCRCKGKGTGWALETRVYVPCQAIRLARQGNEFVLPSHRELSLVLIGFTEHAMPILYECVPEETVVIRRLGNKKNGPIMADKYIHQIPKLSWPTSFPVAETLGKVFGIRLTA